MLDILNISPDSAAANNPTDDRKGGKKEKDVRLFHPNINNAEKEYQARIRQLPQGLVGIQNNLPVSVEQHTHFIKEKEHGLWLTVKCRKTLGPKEECPICKSNWAMYDAAKLAGDKQLIGKALDRKNQINHIGNFLIRDDITNPENTDTVKLWRHTNKMHKTLMEPTLAEIVDANKKSFSKKKERFTPYSPVNGKDFYVIITENPENGIPSYDGSYWDEEGLSNLAPTEDEMMAYLESCHDLREFIEDVKPVDEINRLFMEFNQKLEEKMGARSGGFGSQPTFMAGDNGMGNSAPSTGVPASETTSGADYFAKPVETSEPVSALNMNADTPKFKPKAPVDEPMISGNDEEDELPF